MNRMRIALSCSVALVLSGCDSDFEPKTPDGFVAFETGYQDSWWEKGSRSAYAYRATTPDGVVLAIRKFDNDPAASVSYWSEALQQRLNAHGSYTVSEQRDVENHQGIAGHELVLAHRDRGAEHLYRVALFVHEGSLFVLEAGGNAKTVTRWNRGIDEAIGGITFE